MVRERKQIFHNWEAAEISLTQFSSKVSGGGRISEGWIISPKHAASAKARALQLGKDVAESPVFVSTDELAQYKVFYLFKAASVFFFVQ